MPIVNADIAAVFDEIADLLEVEGANAFRIRAYRNAARTLSELGRSVGTMVDRGEDRDALPELDAHPARLARGARRAQHAAARRVAPAAERSDGPPTLAPRHPAATA